MSSSPMQMITAKALIEAFPNPVAILRIVEKRLLMVQVNDAFAAMTGKERSRLEGANFAAATTFSYKEKELTKAILSTIDAGLPNSLVFHLVESSENSILHKISLGDISTDAGDQCYLATCSIAEASEVGEELRYRLAMECAELGLFDWDLPSGQCVVSDEWYRQLGLKVGKRVLPTHELLEVMSKGTIDLLRDAVTPALEGSIDIFDVEFPIVDSVGETRWIRSKGKVHTRDRIGVAIRIVGVNTNVTHLKKVNEELRRNQRLFNQICHMVNAGGWEFFPETEDVLWTDELFRIFDIEKGNPKASQDALSYFVPGDREILTESFTRLINEGVSYDHELRLVSATGNLKWVRVMAEWEKSHDTAPHVWGVMMDITAEKRAEERERNLISRFQSATCSANIGVWQFDIQRGVVEWDEVMYSLFGLDPGTRITRELWDDLILEEDREMMEREVESVFRVPGMVSSKDYRITLPDGSIRYIHGIAKV
ncbi:MAG: PAS domain-containing protein, partial [Candidatus Sumerlaeia bacterium]|nr:PAS domain-containing protein [Candidatus Sumerlaeia bacterium]